MPKQFSLMALMVAVSLACVLLATFRTVPAPDFTAIDPIIWGGLAMLAGIGLVTSAGVWWFNT